MNLLILRIIARPAQKPKMLSGISPAKSSPGPAYYAKELANYVWNYASIFKLLYNVP